MRDLSHKKGLTGVFNILYFLFIMDILEAGTEVSSRPAHLWKPGVSANPAGRQPGPNKLTALIKKGIAGGNKGFKGKALVPVEDQGGQCVLGDDGLPLERWIILRGQDGFWTWLALVHPIVYASHVARLLPREVHKTGEMSHYIVAPEQLGEAQRRVAGERNRQLGMSAPNSGDGAASDGAAVELPAIEVAIEDTSDAQGTV